MKKFINGTDMYQTITSDIDLYSKETETYVFAYNDHGSIAVYSGITIEQAAELNKKMQETGEGYWGALLGPGGYIYDSADYKKEYPYDTDDTDEALEWCNTAYAAGDWIATSDFEAEQRIWEMLQEQAKEYECSIEEVKEIIIEEYGEYGLRGYGVFDSDDVEVEHIERIDVFDIYDGDLDAAEQAEKDGVKLIPFELNPIEYPYNCYRFIDTPENREKLSRIKRNQYFYDDDGNEYWYDDNNEIHYVGKEV